MLAALQYEINVLSIVKTVQVASDFTLQYNGVNKYKNYQYHYDILVGIFAGLRRRLAA